MFHSRSVLRFSSAVLVLSAAGLGAAVVSGPAAAVDPCSQSGSTVTCTYTQNGTFTVPAEISSLRILVVGGNGGAPIYGNATGTGLGTPPPESGTPGSGAAATSDVPVDGSTLSAGMSLAFVIGGNANGPAGGANGGGNGAGSGVPLTGIGGGGGGMTVVARPTGVESIVAVAAGGGGGGAAGLHATSLENVQYSDGGDGGNAYLTGTGRNGTNAADSRGGTGGTVPTGGVGGPGGSSAEHGVPGGDGSSALGPGGNGGQFSGAGGGAGFAGGGGGGGGGLNVGAGEFGGGGGGAAGTNFTLGTSVSVVASDGTPRVEFSYQAPPSTFDPGPTATISGDARVGSTLTAADEGSTTPEPTSYTYQWFADGVAIDGATGKMFMLTSAQKGKRITVKLTAHKDGVTDASDTSGPTAPVVALAAKHLELETTSSTYAGNSISVKIDKLSKAETYTIRIDDIVVKTGAANSDGNVSTKVTVPLTLHPGSHTITGTGAFADRFDTDALRLKTPSDLDVELKSRTLRVGSTQIVYVDDLLKGEKVEVRVDGGLVSPSNAVGNSSGEYKISFPAGVHTGTRTVTVTGTYDGRTTTKTYRVVAAG